MGERADGMRLSGVPETTLWTLYNRASEAARPDALIHDPWAVRLRDSIDHPYLRVFGRPSQTHPLRALCFDKLIRKFLTEHPGGTVVSLGEGLETGFWRIADPGVRWVSLDLPEIIALREKLLPAEPQVLNVARSVLDRSWMDIIEPDADVLISAQGLLMYFQPADVFSLITDCGKRFPGGRMIFDTIPSWLSQHTLRGWTLTPHYTAPPMPFGISVSQLAALPQQLPAIATLIDVEFPRGRGLWRWPTLLFRSLPVLRVHRPAVSLVTFAEQQS